jgi:crotonobetainyl-CoA:carnitine CoA-transferase CaiB-like acyl-CoA transferase
MSIYLKDEDKKEDRRNLLRTLDLWINMLEENSTIDEMLSACNAEVNEVSNLLATNQLAATETVKELERAYRELNRSMTTPDRIRLPISQ